MNFPKKLLRLSVFIFVFLSFFSLVSMAANLACSKMFSGRKVVHENKQVTYSDNQFSVYIDGIMIGDSVQLESKIDQAVMIDHTIHETGGYHVRRTDLVVVASNSLIRFRIYNGPQDGPFAGLSYFPNSLKAPELLGKIKLQSLIGVLPAEAHVHGGMGVFIAVTNDQIILFNMHGEKLAKMSNVTADTIDVQVGWQNVSLFQMAPVLIVTNKRGENRIYTIYADSFYLQKPDPTRFVKVSYSLKDRLNHDEKPQ